MPDGRYLVLNEHFFFLMTIIFAVGILLPKNNHIRVLVGGGGVIVQ